MRSKLVRLFAVAAVLSQSALAEAPSDSRREFAPDRPGSTVSTTTIDPGTFQFEMQIATYTVDKFDAEKITQLAYPIPAVRFGLTQNSEMQLAIAPYVQNEFHSPGMPVEKVSGMGDTVLVYKYNFQGNNGEAFGLGLMPVLKIPTNTGGVGNNKWEPALAVPLAWSSEFGWSFSVLPGIDLRKNADDKGMHVEYNYPLNISHSIAGPVDGFADYVVHTSNDRAFPTTSYFGAGLTVQDGGNAQYDVGCNFGLNKDTPDYSVFVGWSFRPD